ncbi:MAG TPA: ABC transporter ATP-binding protein [Clostridiales bacterium]|nr:ABC transporter ATP-binding protein [Clostridiales bacterium]
MLKIRNLVANYGHIEALHGISLDVGNKEMVALIGSNGAGKTTLLNSISGHVTKTGEIIYNDVDISKMKPGKIVKNGIIQVPEGRHVFPGLTVMQNLVVGTIAWRGLRKADIEEDLEKVTTLFPRLKERYKQLAWSLSGGEQQMLAMGRALMSRPKLLMLDEPSMGLAPKVVDEMFDAIVAINKGGTPILLVEQNAQLALEVSSKAYIIEGGRIKLGGPSKELASDDRVREAYLGKSH